MVNSLFDCETLDSLIVKKKKTSSRKPKTIPTWKFFKISDDLVFFPQYSEGRIVKEIPSVLEPFKKISQPVGFGSYASKNKTGFVTVYLLHMPKNMFKPLAKENKKKLEIFELNGDEPELLDKTHHIRVNHLDFQNTDIFGAPHWKDLERAFKNYFRKDVREFIGDLPLKKEFLDTGGFKSLNDYLTPEKYIDKLTKPKIVLSKPPKNFARLGKNAYAPICKFDVGVDLAKGCSFNITPNLTFDLSQRCSYCYASHENNIPFISSLYNISRGDFKNRFIELFEEKGLNKQKNIGLRLGQTVEMMVQKGLHVVEGFQDDLSLILEDIISLKEAGYKLNVSLPAKATDFDSYLSKLMIDAGLSFQVSVAYEELEPGPVAWGYNALKRLEDGLKYKLAGVQTSSFVATDVTRGINFLQPEAKLAMKFQEDYDLDLQFIDMRIVKKKHAPLIAGDSWDNLKKPPQQKSIDWIPDGRYHLLKQGVLGANFVHNDFLNLIKNNRGNIRVCYTHGAPNLQKCGSCFMDKAK